MEAEEEKHIPSMEGTVHLLDECNFKCTHCYSDKKGNELSLSQIKQIKEYSKTLNIRKFALLGGEPLLHKDIEAIINLLPNVSIYTNGLLVKKKIDLLTKTRAVFVSIDGYEKNSEIVRGKGTWKVAMDAIALLKKKMPEETNKEGKKIHNVLIRCSYSSENFLDIEQLIEDISIPNEIPIIFLPRVDKPPLTIDEQIKLYTYIMTKENTGCHIHQPNFFQYIGEKGECPAGEYRINFCSDGSITPCNMNFNYKLGVIGTPADAIKNNISIFLEHFKVAPVECSACSKVRICKGGCLVSQTYINCPLKHQVDLKSFSKKMDIDISKVPQRFDNIKQIMKDVVSM